MKKLEEIRARVEKATEGPWFRQYGDVITTEPDPRDIHSDAPRDCRISRRAEHLDYKDPQGIKNAEFIAHSRTDVPKLVAALEAVLGLANHEPRFTPVFGAGHTSRSVAADEIIEVIQEALQ